MRGLLAGIVVLFGAVLGLDAFSYQDISITEHVAASANADAAMTPDSGAAGAGYGTQ